MKIAIMQPYLFPYIGYFQLVNAVDNFIFYDDVHYIKKGWINRNRILVNGEAKLFTVPVVKASQNKLINEIRCGLTDKWREGFVKTLEYNYKSAPYFTRVMPIIHRVFNGSTDIKIADLAVKSIKLVARYLDLETSFEMSSDKYPETRGMEKAARLKEIAKRNKADTYINLIGGMDLYDKDDFASAGINLEFLTSERIVYKQFSGNFISDLSLIDLLMFNSKNEIYEMLTNFKKV